MTAIAYRLLAFFFDLLVSNALFDIALAWLVLLTGALLSENALNAWLTGSFAGIALYHSVIAGRTRARSPGEIIVGFAASDTGPKSTVNNPLGRSRALLFVCSTIMFLAVVNAPEISFADLRVRLPELPDLISATLWGPLAVFCAVRFSAGSFGWGFLFLLQIGVNLVLNLAHPKAPTAVLFNSAALALLLATVAFYRLRKGSIAGGRSSTTGPDAIAGATE